MKSLKTIMPFVFALLAARASGQSATDTVKHYPYRQTPDSAEMAEYGMRLYNPAIGRYLPAPNPVDTAFRRNPYGFADKREKGLPAKNTTV